MTDQKTLIIPFRDPGDAKSRLSDAMTERQRADLAWHMFNHVLSTARAVLNQEDILVVTRSEAVRRACRGAAEVLIEDAGDLNGALELAIQQARKRGPGVIGIVHADLPMLEPDDLRIILDIDAYEVGIATDTSKTGTNALTFVSDALITPRFGAGSFRNHISEIKAAGLEVWPVVTPGLMHDVDWPADLGCTDAPAATRSASK